jgi:hypothetical protein
MHTAEIFLNEEIVLARPELIIALGKPSYQVLSKIGVKSVSVPHPAARIGNVHKHILWWEKALKDGGFA